MADGDVARNFVNPKTGAPLALGFNPIDRFTYSNKDFLLNAVEYLRDDAGRIAARGREVKLRLLDTNKAKAEETLWTLLNIGGPLVLLGVFGIVYSWLRRRRYALPAWYTNIKHNAQLGKIKPFEIVGIKHKATKFTVK